MARRGFDGRPGLTGYSQGMVDAGFRTPRADPYASPALDGYGETYASGAQETRDAQERMRQNVADARNIVGLMSQAQAYGQGEERFAREREQWERQDEAAALQMAAMREDFEKARRARELADLQYADVMAQRQRREEALNGAEFPALLDVMLQGAAQQDTLDALNAARVESGRQPIVGLAFGDDGMVHELYEDGSDTPYQALGTLAQFFDAYPEFEQVARTALPGDILAVRDRRQRMAYEMEAAREKAKSDAAQQDFANLSSIAGIISRQLSSIDRQEKSILGDEAEEMIGEGDPRRAQLDALRARRDSLVEQEGAILDRLGSYYGLTGKREAENPWGDEAPQAGGVPNVSVGGGVGNAPDWKTVVE